MSLSVLPVGTDALDELYVASYLALSAPDALTPAAMETSSLWLLVQMSGPMTLMKMADGPFSGPFQQQAS